MKLTHNLLRPLTLIVLFGALLASCLVASRIPARDILVRGEAPREGLGAYGYVLLTMRPDPNTLPRFVAICEAFQRSLEPVETLQGIDSSQLMVTFWLLGSSPESSDCSSLVANYDFSRATPIAQVIGKLGVSGPILVAWRHPFGSVSSEEEALVLDMSDFQETDDITRAFLIWREHLSREPSAWKDGFRLAQVRELFRIFLNRYGEQIVAIIRAPNPHPAADGAAAAEE